MVSVRAVACTSTLWQCRTAEHLHSHPPAPALPLPATRSVVYNKTDDSETDIVLKGVVRVENLVRRCWGSGG